MFSKRQRTSIFSMTLYLEIFGETEKSETMMGTKTFIRDDHPGLSLDSVPTQPTIVVIKRKCIYGLHVV